MSPSNVEPNRPVFPLDSSLLVRANQDRTLYAFGETLVIVLDGKQTGEKFTAFLSISPPGGGPGPHYHEREDEWFYIVEGRVDFFIKGTWTELSPGIAFTPPAARSTLSKIIPMSLFACSSILSRRESNIFSPKQPRNGRNQSPT
jgi:glyoxylate utilization-related uncharacterized protein